MTSTPQPAPSTPSAPGGRRRSLTSRTSLITAAAIAGVLIAGTAAVAANIGILNSADSSAIGDLAATDQLLPAPDQQIVYVDDTSNATSTLTSTGTETSPTGGDIHQFDIDSAGSVWVMTTRSGLALDHVEALDGWTPALSQVDLRSLRVDFTNGARTIVFTASLAPDGTVAVDVTEPATNDASANGDDDHHDDDHRDGDHKDDDHKDDDHHEGADDDD